MTELETCWNIKDVAWTGYGDGIFFFRLIHFFYHLSLSLYNQSCLNEINVLLLDLFIFIDYLSLSLYNQNCLNEIIYLRKWE